MHPDRVSEEAAHYYATHHECGNDPWLSLAWAEHKAQACWFFASQSAVKSDRQTDVAFNTLTKTIVTHSWLSVDINRASIDRFSSFITQAIYIYSWKMILPFFKDANQILRIINKFFKMLLRVGLSCRTISGPCNFESKQNWVLLDSCSVAQAKCPEKGRKRINHTRGWYRKS